MVEKTLHFQQRVSQGLALAGQVVQAAQAETKCWPCFDVLETLVFGSIGEGCKI